MSVTIADILGANNDDGEKKEYHSDPDAKLYLDKFKWAADDALQRYRKMDAPKEGISIIAVVSSPVDDHDEKWIFLVEIENDEAVGMIVFPVDRLSNIMGILMGVWGSDGSESEGNDS